MTTVGKDGGVIELVGQAMMVVLDTKEEVAMGRVAQRSPRVTNLKRGAHYYNGVMGSNDTSQAPTVGIACATGIAQVMRSA